MKATNLCRMCPIKPSTCVKKCSSEIEQTEKIMDAEELWLKCNDAYEAMCSSMEIINDIEEEYEY